ncbi:MAG: hypothetical protein Q7K98_04495 [Candidatus Omnitrophota bacterium]|nr:hypothetical protein [Candidatus Omnitrophota bacterium]
MELKLTKITLRLIISAVFTLALLYPVMAADNSYSVRISCIIPAIPGKNMPILQEPRVTNTKEQANSPAIFQKDTQEIRVIAGEKLLLDLETLYSR